MAKAEAAAGRRTVLGGLAAAAILGPGRARAGEPLNLVLNWTPTADHAPYYHAKAQGWYEQAGIDLTIETGRGSGTAAQRVAAGGAQLGIADMATAMLARSRGSKLVAVMVVYANSPQGFYWLKSNGIAGPKDFSGRSIGNPPGDASRVMWPAFARKVGIDPASVRFVNVSPQAKLQALRGRTIDITSDFYNEHDLKLRQFGDDLGFLAWREIGLNPYGNSIIANEDVLAAKPKLVADFVRVSQRAFAAAVQDVGPALKALLASVSGLEEANQRDQWRRILELMRDPTTEGVALGAFDAGRVAADYDLLRTYFENVPVMQPDSAFTNRFLDTGLRMPAG
ncbi:ABC transporter substrate-binding protein [Belnapia rosea]|uniref:NitT/TauT family transport system substrate-binding protein n=1 Tax=Belnapia rosea TaxID=938405 RepID=A0A1G6R643_9PROT|nr:ABC transporter substrate-binding protein [Belnapia rosea]SDC99545.1 NitT/TauT family transport system substrate-binding protein [Belnapia rosea]